MRILVAEDDAPLAEFLHQRLLQEQFAVQMVSTGPQAQRGICSKKPDQPVLMLAGTNVVEDRVRGLNAGADDFVAKPFEMAELAARESHRKRGIAGCRPGAGPHRAFGAARPSCD